MADHQIQGIIPPMVTPFDSELLRLWNAIDAPNLPANVKTAMKLQGRQGGLPRAPMAASSPEQIEAIRQALAAVPELSPT